MRCSMTDKLWPERDCNKRCWSTRIPLLNNANHHKLCLGFRFGKRVNRYLKKHHVRYQIFWDNSIRYFAPTIHRKQCLLIISPRNASIRMSITFLLTWAYSISGVRILASTQWISQWSTHPKKGTTVVSIRLWCRQKTAIHSLSLTYDLYKGGLLDADYLIPWR